MAFDESPRFDGDQVVSHTTLQGWIHGNRRLLMVLVVFFLVLDGFLVYSFLLPAWYGRFPGGLDGCLVLANGEPVSAVVWVGEEARQTYEDGCFFFSELPPGQRQITVEAVSGEKLVQTVEIVSGQAVGMGTVTVR